MNRKGQFSIIAALLVAVILIATVIVTYSIIRSSPVSDIPQVLSAIDETNLALRQVLGFTIGYYGSVLQVTGNTTYAKMLAENYLSSGLIYIADMHPDWGASFSVTTVKLQARWFERMSYSMGNLKVSYNLTGLGIYGVSYEVTCKLNVSIVRTVGNKAYLSTIADENKSLVNLGKSNFKFYKYDYESSEWKLAPVTELKVLLEGKNVLYEIGLPSGVDPDSYVIQVEDERGIKVVASSSNRYSLSIRLNPEVLETKYAVTGDSNVIGPPDGVYTTVTKNGGTCSVSKYQGGTGIIRQVFFNITYYGSGNGNLTWACQLPNGTWYDIGTLEKGGSAAYPKTASFNATTLWPQWTWGALNSTVIQFMNKLKNNVSYVDAIYVTLLVEKDLYSSLKNATMVIELLQNGTLRWLGQSLEMKTKVKPIPPIPVKSIRVNQTINGVNCEVPFQIEYWVSDYRVPLGLASNTSLFDNRHMIVFLINPNVSKVTIWWNGEDKAVQTPLAYKNKYFRYKFVSDTVPITISNGILNLTIDFSLLDGVNSFKVISRVNTFSATAVFMRINGRIAHYGWSKPMYSVLNGPVRAVLHHEVEWPRSQEWPDGGIPNCPNVYAHIVLTLPANATYYTYQLRLIFLNSTGMSRTIRDLCPISVRTTESNTLTENGTLGLYPKVSTASGLFYNASGVWQHHWAQITNPTLTKGVGIMFTDAANRLLYYFDNKNEYNILGKKTGALNITANIGTIELLPVAKLLNAPVSFTHALDITWYGAIVTFDGTTPIYKKEGNKISGLWVLVEHPPVVSVVAEG